MRTPNNTTSDTKCVAAGKKRWCLALGLFLASLLLVGATLRDYGVSWDEPPYYHAADLHARWVADLPAHLFAGNLQEALDDNKIKAAWHWDPYHVPHPPFSRIVSGLTKYWFHPALDKITAYRLAPALFFAALVTVMFLWMSRLFDMTTGLFSALALMLIPNLFGYAHLAVTDLPLAALWFVTAFCFSKGLHDWRWSIAFGVVWGLALATKFPALLIPIPLILWAHFFHRDKYTNNVFCMLFVAPIVMIAIQPYLWHQTPLRVLEFLYEGFSRGYRADTSFAVFYRGQSYASHQLPRYYPFLMVAITTPLPFVLLTGLALIRLPWLKEHASATAFFAINCAFVLALGAMPGAVLHDGVRQLLSALPFVAALAGVGLFVVKKEVVRITERYQQRNVMLQRRWLTIATLIALLSLSPALDVFLSHPFQLSYYNSLVGGVRGAYERGFETTYFLEAINREFLHKMNERLPKQAKIHGSFANSILAYYQSEGLLRKDLHIVENGLFEYYALLNRRSALRSKETALFNSKEPLFWTGIGRVPLVGVFGVQ